MAVIRKRKPYEYQLERVKRWKNRIDKIINEYKQGKLSVEPLDLGDMICCFFICCDHMKDYIDKDDTIETEQSPYDYLKENICLKDCREISIGTKHLEIRESKKSRGPFKINVVSNRNKETGELFVEVNIKSNTVKENFSTLANECIEKWEEYIKKEITSKPKKQIKINCPSCKKYFEVDEDLIMCNCPKCGLKNILPPKISK